MSAPVRPGGDFSRSAWFRAGVALAVLVGLPLVWSVLCTATSAGVPWNAARLAPAFALSLGQPIYALRDSGQHLGWFYGPGFPVWNLPVTWTDNPTLALWFAGILNVFTWLVPVACVLRASGARRGLAATGAVIAGVLLLGNRVTNSGFYFIHVDALCLATGLGACVALHRAAVHGARGWLPIAALLLVASCWTKQISCFLGVAMMLWLWLDGHRALLGRFVFWCVSVAALSALLVFAFFGAEEVIFNTWLVHSRNPWRGGAGLLGAELLRMALSAWVWLPALALLVWLRRRPDAVPLPASAAGLVRLLTWAAVIQLPLGLLALLKAGGGLNSLHSVHYLMIILVVRLFHLLAHSMAPRLAAGLLWLAAIALPLGSAAALALGPGSQWKITHTHEYLVKLARENPGRYYFPWNPLATLIAEHRVQPLDDALYCLWLSRLEPPADKIRAAVPANPIILYEEPAQSHFAMRYFPQVKGARQP